MKSDKAFCRNCGKDITNLPGHNMMSMSELQLCRICALKEKLASARRDGDK